MFKADFDVTGPLVLSFTFKLDPKHCIDVALQLDTNKMPAYILLCPETSDDQGTCTLNEISVLLTTGVRTTGIFSVMESF